MEKSKLEKYREERARHLEKIADLQKRVRALDQLSLIHILITANCFVR